MSLFARHRLLPVALLVLALAAASWWAVGPASEAAPTPSRAATAGAGTLTVVGLTGSSAETTLPVLAFSTGGSNSSTFGGGGAGSGRFTAQDVSVVVDTSSVDPLLLRAVATGGRLPHATVLLADGTQEWRLDDVMISSAAWGRGDAKAGSVALSLAYAKVHLTSYDSRGNAVSTFCYDVLAVRAC